MNTINRLSEVLHKKYGYYVPLKEIGYESIFLHPEEIDPELLDPERISHFTGALQTETACYEDVEGNYFLCIQVELGEVEPYEIWLVNDELKKDFLDDLK